MNANIFRAYDIRGVADRDLTDDVATAIAQAIGTMAIQRGCKPVFALGRDARLSSPRIHAAFVRGLLSTGIAIRDIGVVATPMLYFSVHNLDVGGGIMITGSHNPGEDNGCKVMLGLSTLHGEEIQEVRQLAQSGQFSAAKQLAAVENVDIHTPYANWLVSHIHLGERPLNVVVDCGNGPTGPISPVILERLGCKVTALFTEPDGHFPNHHPDPTVEKNLLDLRKAVAEQHADVGIAYDGDGDRIGVLDEKGRVLWGDRLMIILSRALLQAEPGAAIVGEVKCSQTLFDDIALHGGRPVMSKVGHSLIKDRMKQEHALLAGEMSGHIFYKHRYFGYDDATYASCRLLEILSHHTGPLSTLLDGVPETFATPELRLNCPEELKFSVVQAVTEQYRGTHEVIDIDGARVKFADGWGLVRASNTGPILVMRCEATSPEARDRIRAELTAAIEQAAGRPVTESGH